MSAICSADAVRHNPLVLSAAAFPNAPTVTKNATVSAKKRVLLYKMSFRCVEMSLFLSGKLASFCLFSYTFRLPTSFINIFFSMPAPGASFSPPPRRWPPLRRMICPKFSASVWAFVLSSGRPGKGAALRSPQTKPEPRYLVKRIPCRFPTGRKKFYTCLRFFLPVGKPELRVSDIQLSWRPLTQAGAA